MHVITFRFLCSLFLSWFWDSEQRVVNLCYWFIYEDTANFTQYAFHFERSIDQILTFRMGFTLVEPTENPFLVKNLSRFVSVFNRTHVHRQKMAKFSTKFNSYPFNVSIYYFIFNKIKIIRFIIRKNYSQLSRSCVKRIITNEVILLVAQNWQRLSVLSNECSIRCIIIQFWCIEVMNMDIYTHK